MDLIRIYLLQVKTAIKDRMFAVDISNTTLSVHQVGQMGYYSSHARRDASANLKVRFICEENKYRFFE